MKHALFTMARHIVSLLLFVQRFPVFLLFLMGLAPLWLCHRVRTVHFCLVVYMKTWIWLYFKCNGIRIDYNKAALRQFDQDIVVCNYSAMIDYAVLFLVKKMVM